jgi:hypothetical protein
MASRITFSMAVCSFVSVVAVSPPQTAQGQYYSYPPAASYACPQPMQYSASYAPTTVYYQPAAPQIQTVWRQVPVTTYETRSAFNPITGNYYSYSQPITTMQWQSQPVARTAYSLAPANYSQNLSLATRAPGYMSSTPTQFLPQPVQEYRTSDGTFAQLQDTVVDLVRRVDDLESRP